MASKLNQWLAPASFHGNATTIFCAETICDRIFGKSTTLSHLTPKIFPPQTRHCTAQINIVVSTDSFCTMNYQKFFERL